MGYLCIQHLSSIVSSPFSFSSSYAHLKFPLSQLPISRYCHGGFSSPPSSSSSSSSSSYGCSLGDASSWRWRRMRRKRELRSAQMRASMRESPYDVLGVSPSSTSQQIKRAYRKLALKYHPDVNKEKDAEEKFMRIKHAYNTLITPKRKREDYPNTRSQGNQRWTAREEEEEFYGFGNIFSDVQITIGDFFRDLQVEYQNWESSANSQERPKSLWEELADIGEEFVEFLEKELNITDKDPRNDNGMPPPPQNNSNKSERNERRKGEDKKRNNINDNIDDVEAALAKLKKELGL